MSLELYRIFNAIAKEKSLARAAEVLNLASSTISHSLSRLEKQLGFTLFVRNSHTVELTANGRHLLPYMNDIVHCEERLLQEAAKVANSEHGTVSIGTFSSVCVCWLPHIIQSFSAKHPKIEIIVYQGGYDDIIDWINNRIVDIAFVSRTISGQLDVTDLYQDKLMCIVPKGVVPQNGEHITSEDLREHKLILQRAGNNAEVVRFLHQNSLSVSTLYYVEDDASLAAMVECGLGICLMPELVIQSLNDKALFYPVFPEYYRTIGLAITNLEYCAPAAKLLHDHIVEYVNVRYSDSGISR